MGEPSWVLRTAVKRRECMNCDDYIYVGGRYFRFLDGTIYCCACPPDGVDEACE